VSGDRTGKRSPAPGTQAWYRQEVKRLNQRPWDEPQELTVRVSARTLRQIYEYCGYTGASAEIRLSRELTALGTTLQRDMFHRGQPPRERAGDMLHSWYTLLVSLFYEDAKKLLPEGQLDCLLEDTERILEDCLHGFAPLSRPQ
jgi:hypothetical protein